MTMLYCLKFVIEERVGITTWLTKHTIKLSSNKASFSNRDLFACLYRLSTMAKNFSEKNKSI